MILRFCYNFKIISRSKNTSLTVNHINSQYSLQSHFRDRPRPLFEDFGAFTVFVELTATEESASPASL